MMLLEGHLTLLDNSTPWENSFVVGNCGKFLSGTLSFFLISGETVKLPLVMKKTLSAESNAMIAVLNT
jgi:hypothetical protein